MGNFTFALIKPAAAQANHIGAILSMIEEHGFVVTAIKKLMLSKDVARIFYAEHEGKPFYNDLVDFMTSSPVIALILSKENAVTDFRKLIGSTNPDDAEEGTIRKQFATSLRKNAVHGSDSDDNAMREANYFFSQLERF